MGYDFADSGEEWPLETPIWDFHDGFKQAFSKWCGTEMPQLEKLTWKFIVGNSARKHEDDPTYVVPAEEFYGWDGEEEVTEWDDYGNPIG